jgi:hypothetical protein
VQETLLGLCTIKKPEVLRKLKTLTVLHRRVCARGRDMHEVDLLVEGHHFAQLTCSKSMRCFLPTLTEKQLFGGLK